MTAYRFIQKYGDFFGVRWLLKRPSIYPNAYYNFLKNRKAGYHAQKQETLQMIEQICHEHNGVDGYRTMQVYLERKGKKYSRPTIHKYMNRESGLKSVTRRKKPGYCKGKAHRVFRNIPGQDFDCEEKNTKWCTDFTYLFLSDGSKRYNCTILDLHDRSVIASITDKNITADLAKRKNCNIRVITALLEEK